MKLFIIVLLFMLSGCSTLGNLEQSKQAIATHADLQAASSYSDKHGYPARAWVWAAIDMQLTACNDAISASVPIGQVDIPGIFTAFEIAAESVGTGIPASVRINCAPLPLIGMPKFP